MGQMTNGKSKKEEVKKEEEIEDAEEEEEEEEQEEQDGVSVHSPCKINSSSLRMKVHSFSLFPSTACVIVVDFSNLILVDRDEFQEKSEVDLELKLLEALEIYPPSKLRGFSSLSFTLVASFFFFFLFRSTFLHI